MWALVLYLVGMLQMVSVVARKNCRIKILDKILPGTECKPMVFKVPGAQYISATNNAAGRTHLKVWLMAHRMYPGSMGIRVTLRKDGKRYHYNGPTQT